MSVPRCHEYWNALSRQDTWNERRRQEVDEEAPGEPQQREGHSIENSAAGSRREKMRTWVTAMIGYLLAVLTPVLAQATSGTTGTGTGTTGAGTGTGAAGTAATGGLADWWWIILLVIVIAAAIWYFTSRRPRV
jgi:hypothetical protein